MCPKRLLVAKPRGFCAGVARAIDVVESALQVFDSPLYVRGEIVHNRHAIEEFKAKGVIFVDDVDRVPEGATVILSAHGTSPAVKARAAARRLRVIDASCPLVTKVHLEAIRFVKDGRFVILVGHRGHDEVIGIMGEAPGQIHLIETKEKAEILQVADPERVAVITQTTLSVDDTAEIVKVLRRRFPMLITPSRDDICYATQNRQSTIKDLARQAELVLVLGSKNSSNSNRLKEVASAAGLAAYLIDDKKGIDPSWFEGVHSVALTSGASTPEYLVQEVVAYFKAMGVEEIEEVEAVHESMSFALPVQLTDALTRLEGR